MAEICHIISIRDTCTLIQISIIWHMEIRGSEPSSCEPILVQVTCSFSTQYAKTLVYAIIWLYVIENIMLATVLPLAARHTNAHSRRILQPDAQAAGLYNLTRGLVGETMSEQLTHW